MATSKPSGLARFTQQGGGRSKPGDEAGAQTAHTSPPGVDSVSDADTRDASKPKLVGVYLMPDGHRQIKVEAAKRGSTVSDLVREALNAWFANEHLPPLA